MDYCGLDIAMKSSYRYITDGTGRKITSGEIPTSADTLRERLPPHLRGGLRVALEAGNQSRSTARLRQWYRKVASHRGKKTAVVALARKRLTIAYRLLRDGTPYRSSQVCQAAEDPETEDPRLHR